MTGGEYFWRRLSGIQPREVMARESHYDPDVPMHLTNFSQIVSDGYSAI
jgi:hypothetical protein